MEEQQLTKRERRALKRQEKLEYQAKASSKRKSKRMMTWLVATIIIVGAGYGVFQLGSSEDTAVDGGSRVADVDRVVAGDHIKGNPDARVTLVEYSDFQCPACGSFAPIVRRLGEEFGEDLRIVYRHFPLVQIHTFANLAGRASIAASNQGKFWQMHDLLFANQSSWSRGSARDAFIGFAKDLELDLVRFEEDIDAKSAKDKVADNYASGLKAGVNSTPSFFLDGVKLANPRSYDEFASLVSAAIAASSPLEFESLPLDDDGLLDPESPTSSEVQTEAETDDDADQSDVMELPLEGTHESGVMSDN